jgi:phosphohistidine phosphatase
MNILFVRHPVSPIGRARFGVAARGLAKIVGSIDVLVTSPRTDAWESASIVAKAFKLGEPVVEPALGADRIDPVVARLIVQPPGATVALVGHEPILGGLLAYMLGASGGDRFTFRKGGAALVHLPDGPWVAGRLAWFLPPRVLRALAGASRIGGVPSTPERAH